MTGPEPVLIFQRRIPVTCGYGVTIRQYHDDSSFYLECQVCGETGRTIAGPCTAEVRAAFHRDRHRTLDPKGGPDRDEPYGWSQHQLDQPEDDQ